MGKAVIGHECDVKVVDGEYGAFLVDLKNKVKLAQSQVMKTVNTAMVVLYWEIGRAIQSKQESFGWGAKIIEKLAMDLKRAFPNIKGFSSRNLKYMLKFARAYPSLEKVQQHAAQIPWFHNVVLLEKVRDERARLWYIEKTIENGWSRSALKTRLDSRLYEREGRGVNNFEQAIGPIETNLARNIIKDPYCFDFLNLKDNFTERELEEGLLEHLQHFLLEIGEGFSFVGRQKHLSIGGQDFYIDMLFYNYKLRRFFVVELKTTDFKPEYVGKLNFYLAAVDDLLKRPDDELTIGLLLCKGKNKVIAEYALRNIRSPMNIAEFETGPENLKKSLPPLEDIERELK